MPDRSASGSVFIIDDHAAVRQGLRAILEDSGRYSVSGAVASAEEAREALAELREAGQAPSILIIDLNLKGQSGIDFVREAARTDPDSRCVMISVSIRFDSIIEAMAAGARGYIGKDQDEGSTLRVLDAVARGDLGLDGEVLATVLGNALRLFSAKMGLERSRYDSLTPREKEVFRLTILNRSVGEIASSLDLSTKTIDNVRSAILGKLGVQDRFEMYRYALRIGVIEE
ncbi:MAG TPA: response regulator transcription factor [Rectinemataceae bacterium]|nr:response regulator transcription factor [Rectinemataceae bacterium]